MIEEILIGLVGDRSAQVRAHKAIPIALEMAASALNSQVSHTWLETANLAKDIEGKLAPCEGFWCVPGSPYADMSAALAAIKFARRNRRPFLGTCGGFQHALIEYARNVLGQGLADHLESNPATDFPLIAPLSCSLVGAEQTIHVKTDSRAGRMYNTAATIESFHCNYGLNPRFETLLTTGPLRVTGRDASREVRIVELETHPFFVATLFQPELKALNGELHPIIRGFIEACLKAGQVARQP